MAIVNDSFFGDHGDKVLTSQSVSPGEENMIPTFFWALLESSQGTEPKHKQLIATLLAL